ncbi:unnamed protein product [Adineta steineri]|uniref:FAD dependent oxidoreductase domain-containing protein n=2 Tax=Adineta steineri TaxID=433720 RepID=A0A814CKA7_9BILA|nr:unnamed protein product [Adineta steineri]
MSDSRSYRVIIVGGGIIGLTTACTLLKEYASLDKLELTIIYETLSPDTTGDVSAGFWEPYGLNLDDERMLRWARYTYDIFMQEFFSTKAAQAGISQMPGHVLKSQNNQQTSENDDSAVPSFLPLVRHYRVLKDPEIRMFDHLGPVTGFVMSSVVTEVRRYLPQLQRFLECDPRVRFVKKKIQSFSELKSEADIIINCTGLGAKELTGDLNIRPARGQVIRVHAPWIKAMYYFETLNEGVGYIIPQSDTVVLGGTFQLDDWNKTPTEQDTRHIRRMCAKILPALEQIQDGNIQAGLRPYRDGGVRLEHERTVDEIDIVHCYGHSGAGVTLSWGCAKDVVEIIKTLLPVHEQHPSELPEHEQLWRLIL